MRRLLTDRVRLIRGLIHALQQIQGKLTQLESQRIQNVINSIRRDEYQHFLSFSQDEIGQVSYARHPSDKFDNRRRVRMSLSRYLSRQYDLNIRGYSLERLSRRVRASLQPVGDFRVVSGKDIVRAYKERVGGQSCMTGSYSRYTKLYSLLPDKIGLLIYSHENSTARALIWKCDCGHTIVDRIYPNDGLHVDYITEFADKMGWLYRWDNSAPWAYSGRVPISDGQRHVVSIPFAAFPGRNPSKFKYPYMDTFLYGRESTKYKKLYLSNYSNRMSRMCILANGGYRVFSNTRCQVCKGLFPQTWETVDGETCEQCRSEYTQCRSCGRDVHPLRMINGFCTFCSHANCFCHHCSMPTTNDHLPICDHGDLAVCYSCMGFYYISFCWTHNKYELKLTDRHE